MVKLVNASTDDSVGKRIKDQGEEDHPPETALDGKSETWFAHRGGALDSWWKADFAYGEHKVSEI